MQCLASKHEVMTALHQFLHLDIVSASSSSSNHPSSQLTLALAERMRDHHRQWWHGGVTHTACDLAGRSKKTNVPGPWRPQTSLRYPTPTTAVPDKSTHASWGMGCFTRRPQCLRAPRREPSSWPSPAEWGSGELSSRCALGSELFTQFSSIFQQCMPGGTSVAWLLMAVRDRCNTRATHGSAVRCGQAHLVPLLLLGPGEDLLGCLDLDLLRTAASSAEVVSAEFQSHACHSTSAARSTRAREWMSYSEANRPGLAAVGMSLLAAQAATYSLHCQQA